MVFCRHQGCSFLHTAKCVPTRLSSTASKRSLLTPLVYITVASSPFLFVSVDVLFFYSLTDILTGLQRGEKSMKKINSPLFQPEALRFSKSLLKGLVFILQKWHWGRHPLLLLILPFLFSQSKLWDSDDLKKQTKKMPPSAFPWVQ